MIAVISAAIAPGLALLLYIYLKDKYESEPISVVIKSFVLGALLVLPVMMIQYAFQAEHLFQNTFIQSYLLNGFLEEFFKWFIVIYTAYHHIAFTERYDGIVYTTAVSLGFATAENLFYIYAFGIHIALWRALLPVSSHGLFGIIMGYYIGRAKFTHKKKRWLIFALFSATILHGTYDHLMSVKSVWMYLVIPFMIILWWMALRKMKQLNQTPDPWLIKNKQQIIDQ